MRYIGSKTWCLKKLLHLVLNEAPDSNSLCDPFAGTCTIPRFFKQHGFRVVTGDLLWLSYAFQVANIHFNSPPRFEGVIRHLGKSCNDHSPTEAVLEVLNQRPGRIGWITHNYSLAGPERRKFFTVQNARQVDSIRLTIREWTRRELISSSERWYLIACLLDAADRVANTAGTYYAYLRSFYRKAHRPLTLRPFAAVNNRKANKVHCVDAEELLQSTRTDVLYLDPPYNERDYGAYYHLPELLSEDKTPSVLGKSGRPREPALRSSFCSPKTATEALGRILDNASARLVVLHYAEHGMIKHKDILELMSTRGPTRSVLWSSRPYSSDPANPKREPCRTRLYVCKPK